MDLGDLNDYRYFAAVLDAGGFSAAARALAIPKSRLSRRVAGLEARLGVRLLQRSTRKLTLTDVGREVLDHARALLREAQSAQAVAQRLKAEPSGLVRVSMPAAVLESDLAPILSRYLADHPRVTLETVLTGRRVDLIEEGLDLALRVRAAGDEDPQWATRRLQPARSLLVAAPALAQRHDGLSTPAALAAAPALGPMRPDRRVHWRLQAPDGSQHDLSAPLRLGCEHFHMRRRAAIDGLGVTLLPEPLACDDLQAGRLVQALPGWQVPLAHLQAVYPSQRGLTPAVRALLDALAGALGPAQPTPAP